ncbi:unnamed protein product [Gemmata massiliana]|uniref:Uncharacterized protein n=1 Tax=Gemmata massiliana TaxID=1210884 RepID=A0A6P2D9T1_9BACT|nr:hypothetical protein [Gemmata massiliana]VTR96272.1 unnamed protein product [Gemmata massiliana]
MLRIPEFRMLIDAPAECGLASAPGVYLFGPVHGQFGLGVTRADPADDPAGDLASQYELMAALGPVGANGATILNRRDPAVPFIGAIRNPDTAELFLLAPFNHARLAEPELRRECARLLGYVSFVSPAMEAWIAVLSGAALVSADAYRSTPGAGGYTVEERYALRPDGIYEWVKETQVTVGAGGLSASRTGREHAVGSWDVVDVSGRPALRLDDANGNRRVLALDRRGPDVLLDGVRFALGRLRS